MKRFFTSRRKVFLVLVVCLTVVSSVYAITGFRFSHRPKPVFVYSTTNHESVSVSWPHGSYNATFGKINSTTHFGLNKSHMNSILCLTVTGGADAYGGFTNSPLLTLHAYINGSINSTLRPDLGGLTFNDFGNNSDPVSFAQTIPPYDTNDFHVINFSNKTILQRADIEISGFTGFGSFSAYGKLINDTSGTGVTKGNFHFNFGVLVLAFQPTPYNVTHTTFNFIAYLTGFANPVTCEITLNITGNT